MVDRGAQTPRSSRPAKLESTILIAKPSHDGEVDNLNLVVLGMYVAAINNQPEEFRRLSESEFDPAYNAAIRHMDKTAAHFYDLVRNKFIASGSSYLNEEKRREVLIVAKGIMEGLGIYADRLNK